MLPRPCSGAYVTFAKRFSCEIASNRSRACTVIIQPGYSGGQRARRIQAGKLVRRQLRGGAVEKRSCRFVQTKAHGIIQATMRTFRRYSNRNLSIRVAR
jgi:hypothetical protein